MFRFGTRGGFLMWNTLDMKLDIEKILGGVADLVKTLYSGGTFFRRIALTLSSDRIFHQDFFLALTLSDLLHNEPCRTVLGPLRVNLCTHKVMTPPWGRSLRYYLHIVIWKFQYVFSMYLLSGIRYVRTIFSLCGLCTPKSRNLIALWQACPRMGTDAVFEGSYVQICSIILRS